jgi:hypothetical protein
MKKEVIFSTPVDTYHRLRVSTRPNLSELEFYDGLKGEIDAS